MERNIISFEIEEEEDVNPRKDLTVRYCLAINWDGVSRYKGYDGRLGAKKGLGCCSVKFVNVLINLKRGEKLRFPFIDRHKLHPCIQPRLCEKTRLAYKTGDLSLSRFSNELLDLSSRLSSHLYLFIDYYIPLHRSKEKKSFFLNFTRDKYFPRREGGFDPNLCNKVTVVSRPPL